MTDADTEHDFTPDEIEAGIAAAVRDRAFDVVPDLVGLLAVQDHERAQKVLDALQGRISIVVQLR